MEDQAIWQTCTGIFHDVFGDEHLKIGPATTANDIEGWDSVTHIQLIVSLEKAFGMRFSTGEMTRLKNVGEMVDLIASRTKKSP